MLTGGAKPKRWAGWLCLGLAGVIAGVAHARAAPAPAEVITVCASGCHFATIQAAIDAADPGDSLAVAAGSYSGNLTFDKNLNVQGAGAERTAIVGGQPVVTILPGAEVSLSSVAIRNGAYVNPVDVALYTGGGGIQNFGTLTLTDSVVSGNTAAGAKVATTNDYDRGGYGGGIFNSCGALTLIHSTLSGNTAEGGDHDLGTASGEANGGVGYGGGLFNLGGTVTLITSTISHNEAAGGAGLSGDGIGRGGPGRGAGVYNFGWSGCGAPAVLTLIASTVYGNRAVGGLGIGGGGPGAPGLGGYGSGGAIYNVGDTGLNASVVLINSTVSGNAAVGGDGCSSFDADPAGGHGFGGGISSNALTLSNSTVAYNRAAGGLALGPSCAPHLGGFDGVGVGGGLEHGGSPAYQSARNTIVAYNVPENCSHVITSQGHNLETGNTCGFTAAGDLQGAAAALAPLQSRGGSVLVHPLHIGSAALDAGDNAACPPNDQRGEARPQDGTCDIGAFEGWIPYTLHLPVVVR